jgi:hypothetical protein
MFMIAPVGRPDDILHQHVPRSWLIRAFAEVFAVAIEMPWTDGKSFIAGPRREPRRSLDGMPTTRPLSRIVGRNSEFCR